MSRFNYLVAFIAILIVSSCQDKLEEPDSGYDYNKTLDNSYLDYVNPFIGTGGHGHTYPGVAMPFGMMQLSPDTRLEGWDGCGGYHYSDSIIYGFSHTHLSGTGVSDYGDVLLMPTSGKIILNNGSDGNEGYQSSFSHKNELAEIGEYAVYLEDHNIDVRLTCNTRSGMHKYTFSGEEVNSNIIIDLEHRDQVIEANLEQINDTIIQGKRISNAWAQEQHLYYYIVLSEPILNLESHDSLKIYGLNFGEGVKEVKVRIGISSIDIEGAKNNLLTETPDWNFADVKANNRESWLSEINKIQIKDPVKNEEKRDQMVVFYTALYHSYLNPNTFSDIDGKYRGMDLEIHQLDPENDKQYTVFSLWDTYRATHPLFTITQPKRTNEFIRTMLRQYDQGGELPIWELSANYTGCMIGYHGVSVIADAFAKGYEDFDIDKAVEAMLKSADNDKLGLESYKKYGFVLADEEAESVSKTLEYSYDDWCIYTVLDKLNHPRTSEFQSRALNYKNVFDPSSGFMRAKLNNSWFSPFDPFEVNYHYTEANAWQYSMYVPQDVDGHIRLMGGEEKYEAHLDTLFSAESTTTGRDQADITGLIGQYAHGNEPSHHMAYLYNYIGKPEKTQNLIQEILNEQYHNSPDGLSGNEDCGQMSSWYVLSAMGFYPVAPGNGSYEIGIPLFDEIEIHQGNQVVRITSENRSTGINYVKNVLLDGENLNSTTISHKDLIGGELTFELTADSGQWEYENISSSFVDEGEMVPVPYFTTESSTFKDFAIVDFGVVDGAYVRYTMSGKEVTSRSSIYQGPIKIESTKEFRAKAFKGLNSSAEVSATFSKIEGNQSIELNSEYANQYSAGGEEALIDYIRGGNNYRTGKWQGFREDLEAIINLNEVKEVNKVTVGFLQDIKSWIWYPTQIEVYLSTDGENFELVGTVLNDFSDEEYGAFTQDLVLDNIDGEAQYVKVIAKNYGVCPEWHLGAGGATWLFVDEIVID